MDYLTVLHTDKGIKKETNQDALLLKIAETASGKILLAVICDGMGGLARGEVASAALIREMSDWFEHDLPSLLERGIEFVALKEEWATLVGRVNERIQTYGAQNGISLGSTLTALLLYQNHYYIINIGDSRIYQIREETECLTKDQTYIQREMDKGNMTYEEAQASPKRNVLLQCVGASKQIEPDYYTGSVKKHTMFMICSDGFRHLVGPQEFYDHLNPYEVQTEEFMSQQAEYLTELNKYRQETDNISVILIRVD